MADNPPPPLGVAAAAPPNPPPPPLLNAAQAPPDFAPLPPPDIPALQPLMDATAADNAAVQREECNVRFGPTVVATRGAPAELCMVAMAKRKEKGKGYKVAAFFGNRRFHTEPEIECAFIGLDLRAEPNINWTNVLHALLQCHTGLGDTWSIEGFPNAEEFCGSAISSEDRGSQEWARIAPLVHLLDLKRHDGVTLDAKGKKVYHSIGKRYVLFNLIFHTMTEVNTYFRAWEAKYGDLSLFENLLTYFQSLCLPVPKYVALEGYQATALEGFTPDGTDGAMVPPVTQASVRAFMRRRRLRTAAP